MLSRLLDFWLQRAPPADETAWHKWNTFVPVRLTCGRRHNHTGQLWRRRTDTGWEYRSEPRGYEDWIDLQY